MTDALRQRLAAVAGDVARLTSVGGGCISPAFRATLVNGTEVFVKTARSGWPQDAFAAEARSLERLRAADALVVPRVLGVDADWLALEWLEPAPADDAAWRALGRGLARLHRCTAETFGWDADNYIGPLPQTNGAVAGSWAAFWRERRLAPLLRRAAPRLDARTHAGFAQLFEALDERLGEPDGAALLHGDLWSGNVHMSRAGAGVIDPASFHGDREVDLAMAELFGGFPEAFFAAYDAEWPRRAGHEARRPIYQLYFLLVHVVLFGGGYAARTARTLDAALGR